MTKKLEELFGFPASETLDVDQSDAVTATTKEHIPALTDSLAQLDKIELALPAVRGLESSDGEMDDLATKATESFDNLMDLGMQVDSRYASEIFGVASQMLGHAITAKNAKINKKLKIIELQLKKAKLDIDTGSDNNLPTAEGHVLDRNELLSRLLNKTGADTPKS
jgi:hypothetical protein